MSQGQVTSFEMEEALEAMRVKAHMLIGDGVVGVAAICLHPRDRVRNPSRIRVYTRVVRSFISEARPDVEGDKAANCFVIALGKISQMMRTGLPSGLADPIMGETSYKGGLIGTRGDTIVFAAYSGGNEAQDVEAARKGLESLGCVIVDSLDFT
jgi:hypothetical protein